MIKHFTREEFASILSIVRPYVIDKNIILSLNLMRLGIPAFDMNTLFLDLKQSLGSRTIAVQTYSEFAPNTPRSFARLVTPVSPYLSSLSKYAFLTFPNCRLLSPTHSFISPDFSHGLLNRTFKSAFGYDSVFHYFLQNDFMWLNIGSYLRETCTFLHHVEQCQEIDAYYRSNITFPVTIYPGLPRETVLISYEYFSKHVGNIDCNWIPVEFDDRLNKCQICSKPAISLYALEDLRLIASSILAKDPWALTTSSS